MTITFLESFILSQTVFRVQNATCVIFSAYKLYKRATNIVQYIRLSLLI